MIGTGITQAGVRDYNGRLLLTLLLRGKGPSSRELADQSGLSPQTVSVILRELESEGMILRGEPMRGRVGKPSVPVHLNPEGLFALGLKIGRRSAELVLMDFCGGIRAEYQLGYSYPMPGPVFVFLADSLADIHGDLGDKAFGRICGLGIALPSQLWDWRELIGAPPEFHDAWLAVDVGAEAKRVVGSLPVVVVNDATAACRAEQVFGREPLFQDYVYFFVGTFVGGGVVLNQTVLDGRQGNAGALGSLPVRGADGKRRQLIDLASLHGLETRVSAAGGDPAVIWRRPLDWNGIEVQLDTWLREAATHLAEAVLATCSVFDFEAVVIDGAMPCDVRGRLVEFVHLALNRMDSRGVILPRIEAGRMGVKARAIGAACSPMISQYLMDGRVGRISVS